MPLRAHVLGGVLWVHTWHRGPGYIPARPGHGAASPTMTRATAPGKVSKISVLIVENLDNAMLPMLVGVRFMSYITRGVIHGPWHSPRRGLLMPPRLLVEVNGVRINTVFHILGGATVRASIEQHRAMEERVHGF